VNRSELVESVEGATGLDRRQADAAVKAVVDAVVGEIASGGKVSIFGFGTFTQTSRAARVGRNPQTGASVDIAASTGVRFAPATALKARLNPAPAAPAAPAKKAPAKKAAAAPVAAAPPAPEKKAAKGEKKGADKKAKKK
jgi:DNA-binding protein HU-beta